MVKGETFPLPSESPANFEQKLFIPFSNPSFSRSEAKSYNHHSSLSLGEEESIKSCNGFKAMGGHGSESKSFSPSRGRRIGGSDKLGQDCVDWMESGKFRNTITSWDD